MDPEGSAGALSANVSQILQAFLTATRCMPSHIRRGLCPVPEENAHLLYRTCPDRVQSRMNLAGSAQLAQTSCLPQCLSPCVSQVSCSAILLTNAYQSQKAILLCLARLEFSGRELVGT